MYKFLKMYCHNLNNVAIYPIVGGIDWEHERRFRLFLEIRPQDLTIRARLCIIEVYMDSLSSAVTAAVTRRGASSWRK